MTTKEASRLLRDYTTGGSEDAFHRLVEGHTGLVEGTARRQLNGDAALAQDVTQTVFATLAANPRTVRGTSVAAWLHRVTVRRRQREQAALVCPENEAVMPEHDDFWTQAAQEEAEIALHYDSIFVTTSPKTSVNRKSRPWKR